MSDPAVELATKLIEPVISPAAVTTDVIARIPDKRAGRNGKARKARKQLPTNGQLTVRQAKLAKLAKMITTDDGTIPAAMSKDVERAWVEKINTAWRKPLEGFFEVGDLLIALKKEFGHGNWTRVCETKLPFKIDTARRLMDIAADEWLRETAHGPFLPRSWRTLYELTKLDDELLTHFLAEGRIHPEMSRKDAENLLTPPRAVPPAPPSTSSILDVLSGTWPDSQTVFLEFIESYFPTVPKLILFRPTGPRGKWQIWRAEITECPETRTLIVPMPGEYFVIRMPLKARADWPEIEQYRCDNCGRITAAGATCECRDGQREARVAAAAEAVRIIKDVVAFRKYRESDLIKNHAFVFSAEAARLVAPKECDGNARRNAVRLLKEAIKEIEAQGS